MRGEKPRREEKGTLSWDSPKMSELKSEWEALSRIKARDEREYHKRERAWNDLVRERLSKQERRQLATSCPTPDDLAHLSQFEWELFVGILLGLTNSGDREGVVTLLSRRCPEVIGQYSVEEWLVIFARDMDDPILILGEAYAKCRVVKVRKMIAEHVRHAFIGLGVTGKDDDEFVKSAMQYYKDEKHRLRVNDDYRFNFGGLPFTDTFRKYPLFKRMPQSAPDHSGK